MPGLGDLGIFDAAIHAFTAVLQGVVAAVVGVSLPYPSPISPEGRVVAILILHFCLAYGMVGYGDLPPIWEEMSRGKGRTDEMATLNQTLIQGLLSCNWVF